MTCRAEFLRPGAFCGPRALGRLCRLCLLTGCLYLLTGCTKQEKEELSAEDKQQRLEAILQQSGTKLPPQAEAAPQQKASAPQKSASAESATSAPATDARPSASPPIGDKNASDEPPLFAQPGEKTTETTSLRLLSQGSAPRSVLSYQFAQGRARKFHLEMKISPQRTINGQPAPGVPAFSLAVSGETKTLSSDAQRASREATFVELIPSVEGAPPQVAQQMKAQFAQLGGLQLLETVTRKGRVEDLKLKQEVVHPQVLALMQYLKDGMTNAFLPLPDQAVGSGAKWAATTTVESSGLSVTQVNTITLSQLSGTRAVVQMEYEQSAPTQNIKTDQLPPGVSVELTKLTGGGSGQMTVDFEQLTVDSKINLSMQVDTKVTQPGAPGPLLESGTTTMKAHMRLQAP